MVQGFPKHVPGASPTLHILHVSFVWHTFQVLELLLMSWWVESGVIDKGDMQNVQCWGGSRNEFGNPFSPIDMGISMWLHVQIVEFYPFSMVENQEWVTLHTAGTYCITGECMKNKYCWN